MAGGDRVVAGVSGVYRTVAGVAGVNMTVAGFDRVVAGVDRAVAVFYGGRQGSGRGYTVKWLGMTGQWVNWDFG